MVLLYSLIPTISSLPFLFFFFNDPATTEIYTLSLHDALPISHVHPGHPVGHRAGLAVAGRTAHRDRGHRHSGSSARGPSRALGDRKSTRLNSSHPSISYAVFCLKKKKN